MSQELNLDDLEAVALAYPANVTRTVCKLIARIRELESVNSELLNATQPESMEADEEQPACGYPNGCVCGSPQCGAKGETPSMSAALPERKTRMSDEKQGLYRKFEVRRVDGSDAPGGKHRGCRYFVLDVDHDAFAPIALGAYAAACEDTHPKLARDLIEEWGASAMNPKSDPIALWAKIHHLRTLLGRRGGEQDTRDAARFRWLTKDLAGDEREARNRLLDRMAVMSYSAACAAIDSAMSMAYPQY